MIPITGNSLQLLANAHAKYILNYYSRRSQKLQGIEKWIQKTFGNNYSFSKILRAAPKDMVTLVKKYNSQKAKFPQSIIEFKSVYTNFSTHEKTPFRIYKNEKYSAHTLVERLGISVCPYCNRNYIFNIQTTKRRTSQLDHFYDKVKFPFLALSFFNLIPACPTCNHLKSSITGNYCNPFDATVKNVDLITFSAKVMAADYLDNLNSLTLEAKVHHRFDTNFKVFKLKELYDSHKDIVQDILRKKIIYTDKYVNNLFAKLTPGIVASRQHLITLLLSNFVLNDELHMRPFSKLTKDIWEQKGTK